MVKISWDVEVDFEVCMEVEFASGWLHTGLNIYVESCKSML